MTKKISPDLQEFLDKDSTKVFLAAVGKFIDVVEADNIQPEVFYRQAHGALVSLYAAGYEFEQINLKYSSADSDFGKTDDEFFKSKNQAAIATLGMDSFYWEVFDPAYTEQSNGDPDKEPTQGWLVDDFAGIYRDLKIDIEKMKLGTDEAIEDALWDMKWSFIHHWGQHCISALRCLHFLWYEGKLAM